MEITSNDERFKLLQDVLGVVDQGPCVVSLVFKYLHQQCQKARDPN